MLIEKAQHTALDLAYDFAQALQSHFDHGVLLIGANGVPLPSGTLARVGDQLPIGTDQFPSSLRAKCWFDIGATWLVRQPTVWCVESWIPRSSDPRLRADWHILPDQSLCYVLRNQWADWLAEVAAAEGREHVPRAAAFYAVNNLRWLLHHHLEAYRRRLPRWDPQWPQWPHGLEDARRAYERTKSHG